MRSTTARMWLAQAGQQARLEERLIDGHVPPQELDRDLVALWPHGAPEMATFGSPQLSDAARVRPNLLTAFVARGC
jgi:hypothetical protein